MSRLMFIIIWAPLSPFLWSQSFDLEVDGAISLQNSASTDSAVPGVIRWSGFVFQGWSGQGWVNLQGSVISDADNNRYPTIRIGLQEWMAENLRTSRYRNGAAIPIVTDDPTWSSTTSGAACSINHNQANDPVYGKLYNWFALFDPRNLCPEGWHVATTEDWSSLSNFLGGAQVAGGRLKDTGNAHWTTPNAGATNESGLKALPAGFRRADGSFDGLGISALWWLPFMTDQFNAFDVSIMNDDANIQLDVSDKNIGYSIRCVRD